MPLYLVTKEYADEHTLMHHGVKGMKKGVRNYQYEDGSLTPLGRKHYGIGEGKGDRSIRKVNNKVHALELKAYKLGSKADIRDKYNGGFGSKRLRKKADNLRSRAADQRKLSEAITKAQREQTGLEEIEKKARDEVKSIESMPDGPKKREAQSKLLKDARVGWVGGKDWDEAKAEKAVQIIDEIEQKSGSWFGGKDVSPGYKKQRQEYFKAMRAVDDRDSEIVDSIRGDRDAFAKKNLSTQEKAKINEAIADARRNDPTLKGLVKNQQHAEQKLLAVVLNDIGYPNTPENRAAIADLVFYDG